MPGRTRISAADRAAKKAEEKEARKAEGESESKAVRLGALFSGMKARHPDHIFMGSEYTMPWAVRRLPFGVADLDVATGGGAPAGGVTMLVGKPSVGKNFLMNKLIVRQQQIYGPECVVALIGSELVYDKTQGRAVGVKVAMSEDEIAAYDTKRRKLTKQGLSAAEIADLRSQIGTIAIIPPTTAEEGFDIAIECVKSGDFNVVGFDSFGSILPEGDQDKDLADGDPRRAGAASLNTQLMRKLNNAFAPLKGGRPNLTAFIGINQVRDKQDAQAFEKKTQESGGWSLKHGRFLTVEVAVKGMTTDKKTGERVAKTIGWEITKQKAGGYEGHVGQYEYVMAKCGIDEGELMLRLGVEYGLIKKEGNKYFYCGAQLPGIGVENAAASINEYDLTAELYDAVLHAAGVTLVT